MEIPYRCFLSSQPLTITAPQGKIFYAHADLIARHSRVLEAALECGMKESATRAIEVKDINGDIDDDTIMRFLEYAYTGDYTVPGPDLLPLNSDLSILPLSNTDEVGLSEAGPDSRRVRQNLERVNNPDDHLSADLPTPVLYSHKKGKKKKKQNMWFEETDETSSTCQTTKQIMWAKFQSTASTARKEVWEPRVNDDSTEDYTDVFLCHARLYVFSSRYQCEGLLSLCLQKLRLTLSKFVLYDSRVHDITQLARYIYVHTTDYTYGMDKLRNLLVDYLVCHVENIMKDNDFTEFLQEPGSMAKDLMVRVLQRLD